MPSPSSRARLVVAGIAAFWLGTLVAGALAPGYSVREDYISSLAGRGSEVAWIGITTLAVLGTTHLVAATVEAQRGGGPRDAAESRVVAVPLALAGLAGLTVAAFRTGCPGGAAGCGVTPDGATPDLADTVHGLAVVGYEIALLTAMVAVAVRLARSRPTMAALTVLAGVASVLLALQIGGEASGLWQRGWLVVNTGWLVWLALRSTPGGT